MQEKERTGKKRKKREEGEGIKRERRTGKIRIK
jgi:hypothetical protein